MDNPNARQVSIRKFPKTGEKPDAILYRADHDGSITSYATYDNKGMIVKRVDMKGKAHNDITTPHVVEWGRNTEAPDGIVRFNRQQEIQESHTQMNYNTINHKEIKNEFKLEISTMA